MRTIGVIGAGHVGLVTAACFAHMGNRVCCADSNAKKIADLRERKMPFYEPGLSSLVAAGRRKGLLSFTTSLAELTRECEILFIAVGTPPTPTGRADLSFVEQASVEIASTLAQMARDRRGSRSLYRLIVEKSTVPVRTGDWVRKTIELLTPTGVSFDVAANPEFLREGSAVVDFLKPDRIVIGVETRRAERIFRELYAPLDAPLVITDIRSAEMIKHASNSFLAMKISYLNAVARICEKVGADIEDVAVGMGYDRRIGKSFLKAGVGYGGSCFPKDVAAFIALAQEVGYDFRLLAEVARINEEQRSLVVEKVRELLWNIRGKTICVLGLSFKPDTDDIRESPALEICRLLLAEGAAVNCYDPKAMDNARQALPQLGLRESPYDAARDADAVLFLTEWKEFSKIDFRKLRSVMKSPYAIDGRNFLNLHALRKAGFVCRAIGRPPEATT